MALALDTVSKDELLNEEEQYFMKEIEKINNKRVKNVCRMPAKLCEYLFLGGYGEAHNLQGIKKRGITHVLNCASIRDYKNNPYLPETGVVGYAQFHGEDRDGYDILQHFPMAKEFINSCKEYGGKVLVHCAVGVNRSASTCIAYLIDEEKMDLLSAMELLKTKRGTVPTNRHFRRELIRFARERGQLKGR